MMTFVMTGCQKEEMTLKAEEFNVEYGENIPTDVKNYLGNSDEFMKNTEISGIPENEKGKTYPAIGQYELKLVNEKMQEKVTVNVQDTTAPVFTDKNTTVTIENGKKIDTKIFKVQDLSEVKITIDDSQIDYTKAGDYIIKVKATDKSNNSTEKEVKLTIKKKETKANTENSSTTKILHPAKHQRHLEAQILLIKQAQKEINHLTLQVKTMDLLVVLEITVTTHPIIQEILVHHHKNTGYQI